MLAKDNDEQWCAFVAGWLNVDYDYGIAPELRHGQRIMNALFRVRPDLYDFVTGTSFDPFYRDGNLYEFGEKVYDRYIESYIKG
jgi:hypothetical protein